MIYFRRHHPMFQTRCIIKTILILLCAISSSCQSIGKPAPLEETAVIAPLNIYESPQDRSIVITYHPNLENIYDNVRSRFKPNQLEFFMISGICLRRLQIKKTFDLYLSLNTKSAKIFQEDQTNFEQRAAAIFISYIKPLLTIAAQEKELLNDELITGIMINNRWQTEKMLNPPYKSISFEQLTFVAQKKEIDDFLNQSITDQELIDRSNLIALQDGETPRIINLSLE